MEKWNAFLKDYNCLYANDQQNGLRSKIKLFRRILFSPNTQVLFLIRYRYSSIGKFCRHRLHHSYHIECSCSSIGIPLRIPHPFNIIIAAQSIGNNVQINQNVTIGGNGGKSGKYIDKSGKIKQHTLPIIEDNVQISPNSVVAGPVTIGHDSIIGANITVTRDIKPHSMLYDPFAVSKRKWFVKYGYQGFYCE